jgi:hypothetical protein
MRYGRMIMKYESRGIREENAKHLLRHYLAFKYRDCGKP